MGEKKKHKEKKKDRKKEEKKKKKDRSSSESDDSDSSDSQSQSSRNNKKDKKSKKVKKEKKSKKESTHQKNPPAPSNIPYDFSNVVTPAFSATIPGIKGMSIPVNPPPLPSVVNPASVPKPKSKQPNIFKLLPKLHYGAVLFAHTIYSGEYLDESHLDLLLVQMNNMMEATIREEQHKKGIALINKCNSDFQKIFSEQKEEKMKLEYVEGAREKSNRYEVLGKIYSDTIRSCE